MKKNLVYLLLIYFIKSLINIFIFFILARILNITDYGLLSFGFAFALLVSAFSEYGYSLLLIRDLNQKTIDKNIQISNVLLQKIILSLIVSIFAFIYIIYFFYNTDYFEVSLLFVLFAIINSFLMLNNAIFKAYEKFKYELITTVYQLIVIVIGLLLLYKLDFMDNIVILSLLFILSRLVSFIISIFYLKKLDIVISITKYFDKRYNKYLIIESSLFGLHAIFGSIFIQFDTQIIAIYLTPNVIAVHQNIFKIIIIFGIFLEIINFAYMSRLAKLYITDMRLYKFNLLIAINFSLFLTLLCFIIFIVFGDFFVSLMFSSKYISILEYKLAIFILIILRIFNNFLGNHLSFSKYQKERAISVIITVFIGVVSSFLLIPAYGLDGAIYNLLLVHFLLFFMYLLFVISKTKFYIYSLNTLLMIIFSIFICILLYKGII